jgi:pullulanase
MTISDTLPSVILTVLPAKLTVPEGKYTVVCKDGFINEQGLGTLYGPEVVVPAQSALIMYK